MIRGRRFFIFLLCLAGFSVSASAAIVVRPHEVAEASYPEVCSDQSCSIYIHDNLVKTDFSLFYDKSLPVVSNDSPKENESTNCKPLTDGTNSLSLCISALIGFGLISSARHIKSFHFVIIPDWYHDAGPSQIGHSLVINPDCIFDTTDCCFVQPVSIQYNSLQPQIYQLKQIVSLWRESQFTPESIAYRGPPLS